jgi:hypothetical protein
VTVYRGNKANASGLDPEAVHSFFQWGSLYADSTLAKQFFVGPQGVLTARTRLAELLHPAVRRRPAA